MLSGVPNAVTPHPNLSTPEFTPGEVFRRPSEVYSEGWTHTVDRVCYVMFEFYNGAMSTDQCRRLARCLQEARQRNDVDVSALRGNAGAGGFMMALAADFVMAHEGVVVNP